MYVKAQNFYIPDVKCWHIQYLADVCVSRLCATVTRLTRTSSAVISTSGMLIDSRDAEDKYWSVTIVYTVHVGLTKLTAAFVMVTLAPTYMHGFFVSVSAQLSIPCLWTRPEILGLKHRSSWVKQTGPWPRDLVKSLLYSKRWQYDSKSNAVGIWTAVKVEVFLPRCMECRRGLAMRILCVRPSVRLSVCPSVRRVDCDKT